jgi:hypothetical protein
MPKQIKLKRIKLFHSHKLWRSMVVHRPAGPLRPRKIVLPIAQRADAATANKKKEKNSSVVNWSWKQPCHLVPAITDVLHERIEALGTTKPSLFMIRKFLMATYVNPKQVCLLFSSKRESLS